jgi:GAF domain-containing protein
MHIAQWLRALSAMLGGRARRPNGDGGPACLPLDADDALIAYLESRTPAPVSVEDLHEPARWILQQQGVSLLVPLVTQGRLVGLLGLGAPAAGRTYSADDLLFLTALARVAAPAVRIAQLLERGRAGARRDAAGRVGTP